MKFSSPPSVKSPILAQFQRRRLVWLRHPGWLVGLLLPVFGVAGVFAFNPGDRQELLPAMMVEQTLPVLEAKPAPLGVVYQEDRVQRGDTVVALATRLNITDPAAIEFLRTHPVVRKGLQLRPGKSVQARTSDQGELLSLSYFDGKDVLSVERAEGGFTAQLAAAQLERRVEMKTAVIRSSLYGATDQAGLSDAVADQMVEMFGTNIDFHKDLRKGDRFTVLYEVLTLQGVPVKTGRIVAAEFINDGKRHEAVWFTNHDGESAYYTLDGKNLRKAFLRSPLEFSRISSAFNPARLHPVLNTVRAHKGTDFAAPTGTKVKATADGVVEFVGVRNGYGNVVEIRHHGKYVTLYGHLSGFGQYRKGQKVGQGDVIGFVGQTGLASGPHLHYEFKIDGTHHDPMGPNLPVAMPIEQKYRAEFAKVAEDMGQRLALLRGTNLARLD